MKKYIFTETQLKHIIDRVIAESTSNKTVKKVPTQPAKKNGIK